jgi:predicted MFS family arabinose efflux permease
MASSAPAPQNSAPSEARQAYLYFGPLTLLVYLVLPHGWLLDIVTSYMLKNQLHATATQVSLFRLFTALPVYVSFLFGLGRDLWNPFGMRDRGFFFLFAPLSAALFTWMALSRLSFAGLFTGMLLVMLTFRFVSAAYQGLLALVGQEKLMSGRLSALWNVLTYVPYFVGSFASGYATEHLRPRETFLIIAALTMLISLFALWKPRAVFNDAYNQPFAKGSNLAGDIRRLLKHRAIYAPILIMLMFQFSPASNTPLQYYLTDHLHASDAAYANFNGIFLATLIPGFLLYGWLCRKTSLRTLLWWGSAIAVPQMVPLLWVHSARSALIAAAPIGLMGGLLGCAIYDLAMRSCPAGMQGTLMMLVDGAFVIAMRAGDLLGSKIYTSFPERGFLYCVIATTAMYALILPLILLVPKDLMATADGERNPAMEAAILMETA